MNHSYCVLGADCSVYDSHFQAPGTTPGQSLCVSCEDSFKRVITSLKFDYIDITQLMVPRDTRTEQLHIFRPKPESSPPWNSAAVNVRDRLAWTVLMAERCLREQLGDAQAARRMPVREGFAVSEALRYLHPRVCELAALSTVLAPWDPDEAQPVPVTGVQVLGVLSSVHRQVRRMCGLDERVIAVPGFCPSCSAPSLRRHSDDPEVLWCGGCPGRLSRQEYLKHQQMIFTHPGEGSNR